MRRRTLITAAGAAALVHPNRRARADEPVDVALVLAVDVSRSIDESKRCAAACSAASPSPMSNGPASNISAR
jgi:hypothetical protein